MAASQFIVAWQLIVKVVRGDNVDSEIMWGAINCSAAHCPVIGIVVCNNGIERSSRQHRSVRAI